MSEQLNPTLNPGANQDRPDVGGDWWRVEVGQRASLKADQNLSWQHSCCLPSRCLKNSNGLAPRFLPRDVAGDANAGSLEPNRLLRLGLNS
jgi:hypothetical protein